MATIGEPLKRAAAGSLLAVAVLFAGIANAPAQNVDLEQQILKSLMPTANPPLSRPATRSLISPAQRSTPLEPWTENSSTP
jgi:hypothetical protein